MKYYVISDIHGHFNEMMNVLNEAEYDLDNKDHQLIINGDMFDRGTQSKEVLAFLYPLYQKGRIIILKGNHEFFLEEFLQGNKKRVDFNCLHNGFKLTLLSLIPHYDELSFEEAQCVLKENYPYLEEFLSSLPFYFETEKYVITHAGLDFSQGDFKKGNFKEAVWTKPELFFQVDLKKEFNFNKTVVVGHRFTRILRANFGGSKEDDSIYYHKDNQKIGIDGGCYDTKQMNVFIFEE